jgi:arylsulfatase A-like enzyme
VITESPSPRWGAGTEFRMIRSPRYKYIAFRDCDDLAFDLTEDPDEQVNLIDKAEGTIKAELEALRNAALADFHFVAVEALRKKENAELKEKYPQRLQPRTPNQILRGDGTLVEADTPLYYPEIISQDPSTAFDDFPA